MNNKLKCAGNALVFACIPLIVCIIYAALQGVMLWEINNYGAHLPQYNDGIFYVKHIAAMVDYGMPGGYFGYNESTAQTGTLGSWPIFLFYPYVILGKIFGFSATHMMMFNLVFVMGSFLAFYYLAGPDIRQSLCIAAFMIAIPLIPRYILSCMSEALFYAGIVLFAGFFVHFANGNYSRKSLYICYLLVVYFALCRPYMLIFIIIPAYYHIKINLIETGVASVLTAGLFAVLYIWFVTPRCAKYIEQTIDTYTFTVLIEKGPFAFVKELIYKLLKDGKSLVNVVMKEHIEVLVPYIIITILIIAFLLFAIARLIKNKKIDNGILATIAVFAVIGSVIAALLIFYVEYTSSRHIIVLIWFAALMASMYVVDNKVIVIGTILLLTFYSYVNIGKADMIYKLPTADNEFGVLPVEEEAEMLQEFFEELPDENPWNNTLIYEYGNDMMNYLHYTPSYMGINICLADYIIDNAENLKSRYVLSDARYEQVNILEEKGYEVKIRNDNYILYQKVINKKIRRISADFLL